MLAALSIAVLLSQIQGPSALTTRAPVAPALRVGLPPARTPAGTVAPRVVSAFELSLTKEIGKLRGIVATGPGDLAELLSAELGVGLRGCITDQECLARVAKAAREDELVSAELSVEGASYAVMLRRLPLRDDGVERPYAQKVKRGDGSELLSLIGPAVRDLYPERELKPGRTRGVEHDAYERLNPPPLPRWVFWTTAGAGLAAATAGLTFGILAKDAQDQYQSLVDQSLTTPVPGSELVSLQQTMDSRSRTANVLYGVAVGLGVAAGIEAFWTDWHGYRSQLQMQPTPGGALVAGGGSF